MRKGGKEGISWPTRGHGSFASHNRPTANEVATSVALAPEQSSLRSFAPRPSSATSPQTAVLALPRNTPVRRDTDDKASVQFLDSSPGVALAKPGPGRREAATVHRT